MNDSLWKTLCAGDNSDVPRQLIHSVLLALLQTYSSYNNGPLLQLSKFCLCQSIINFLTINAVTVSMVSVITFMMMVSMVAELIIEFQVTSFTKGIYFLVVTIVTYVHSLL